MSCYGVYRPTAATLESDRSVISNIHREGTPPVEAAAVIVDLVRQMMQHKASGIALNKALNPGFPADDMPEIRRGAAGTALLRCF